MKPRDRLTRLDRTAKILIDSGKAKNPTEAREYLNGLVLHIAVGPEIGHDPAAQADLGDCRSTSVAEPIEAVYVSTSKLDPVLYDRLDRRD